MKKISVAILSFVVVLCVVNICFSIYEIIEIKNETMQNLQEAYEVIESNVSTEKNNCLITHIKYNENIVSKEGIIGILIIPKLNIEAPINEGTTQEVMKSSVGHFVESNYWEGNVCLAAHNSGINCHFFEKIHMLNKNDEIQYITKLGIKKYKVESIFKVKSTDWNKVLEKSEKNTITLVTCITGKPNYRLCVRGVEVV